VLDDVYGALGLDWDAATVGAVADEATGIGIGDVRRALLAGYATRYSLVPAALGELELARARDLLERHRVPD
jgi:hypothetical protein